MENHKFEFQMLKTASKKKQDFENTQFFRIIFEILKSFRKKIFFSIPKFYIRKKKRFRIKLYFRILKKIFESRFSNVKNENLLFYDVSLGIRLFDRSEFKNYFFEDLKTSIFPLKILTFNLHTTEGFKNPLSLFSRKKNIP